MQINPFHNWSTKTAVLVGLSLTVLVGTVAALDATNKVDLPFFKDKPTAQPSNGEPTVNYAPPTETEKKETEDHKKELVENMDKSTPAAGQKLAVTPVITSWYSNVAASVVEVSGYAPGVVETDGNCQIKLTKDNVTRTSSGSATANAQNMSCGTVTIPFSQLSKGSWNISLRYSSSTAEGNSNQEVRVDIP